MKFAVLFSILLSLPAMAALEYSCEVVGARQLRGDLTGKGSLKIFEASNEGSRELIANGKLEVEYGEVSEIRELEYWGVFENVVVSEDLSYNPQVYKGYSQFENFNATETTRADGGGMWGELIIEKDTSKDEFEAHYIFKSGDHMGGTFDLICHK